MKKLIIILVCILTTLSGLAQNKFVERSGDVLCLVPASTGLLKAIVDKDKKGIVQLGLSTATTIAVNYGLNACVKKQRPDGTGNHAFPSTHTAAAFTGASFLMRRYGWKWGVPAYVISTYVAWGRTYSKKHDWWDVLGGAALGAGSAFLYTRPFVKNTDITIAPVAFGDKGAGIDVAVNF